MDTIKPAPHDAGLENSLAMNSTLVLRKYGSPGSAFLAGTDPYSSKTEVMLEDIPLSNPMLGGMDISLLSSFTPDRIDISHGNVLAGHTVLDLKTRIRNSGLSYSAEAGSFGRFYNGIRGDYNQGRISSTVQIALEAAENNYLVHRSDGSEYRNSHARWLQHSVYNKNIYSLPSSNLQTVLYYSSSNRQLPPTRVQQRSRANQEDHLFAAKFSYHRSFGLLNLKGGIWYKNYDLFYNDDFTGQYGNHTSHTWQPYFSMALQLPKLSVSSKIYYYSVRAISDHYENTKDREITGSKLNLSYLPIKDHVISLSADLELLTRTDDLFYNLSSSYTIGFQKSRLTLTGSWFYDYPALDDLYWIPGGNPELDNESGWNSSLTFYLQLSDHLKMQHRFSYGEVENKILWVPKGAIFSPENILQYNSFSYLINLSGQILKNLSYEVRGKYLSVDPDGNVAYLPNWVLQNSMEYQWGQNSVQIKQRAQGETTIGDNILEAFYLLDLSYIYSWPVYKGRLNLYAGVHNLWDTNYEYIYLRPMPGRAFSAGIRYKSH